VRDAAFRRPEPDGDTSSGGVPGPAVPHVLCTVILS